MTQYVVFLRGINVGGRIIKMADLKACFEAIGFKNVSTVLQTGNVVFDTGSKDPTALKQDIETVLTKTFVYAAKVQIYPIEKLADITRCYPFDASLKNFQHYIVFLEDSLAKDLAGEAKNFDDKIEEVKEGRGVIYWQVQKGMSVKSSFYKHLVKAKYKEFNTVRNLKTLQKILLNRK